MTNEITITKEDATKILALITELSTQLDWAETSLVTLRVAVANALEDVRSNQNRTRVKAQVNDVVKLLER